MAAQKRYTTVNGLDVEQVNFSGNWYTPVEQRIRIALWTDPKHIYSETAGRYRVLSHQILPVGDRWAYTCVVEYPAGSGNTYPGSDFIDTKDPAGLAKAETSAIGRGLGAAGIAIEGGIASADEMSRHVQREQASQPQTTSAQDARNKLASARANGDAQTDIAQRMKDAGLETIRAAREFIAEALGREVDILLLKGGKSDITMGEVSTLLLELNKRGTASGARDLSELPVGART